MLDVFCTDQFNNLHIRSSDPGTVIIGPCCNTVGEQVDPRTFNYHTNSYLVQIRESTKNNRRAQACVNCWNHEDAGGFSRRLNGRSKTNGHQSVGIEKIDWTTQNICNLACTHCSPYSSSLWAKIMENRSLAKEESYQEKIMMLQSLDLSNIRHVHITGGEPLMTKEHIKVLEIIKKSGNMSQVSASYNTNCTFMPSKDVLDLWQEMAKVNVICSIDAVGTAAEILRWPCQWSQVDRIMRDLVSMSQTSTPNIVVTLNVSVANYNFLELDNILNWVNDIDPAIFINWQLVNQSWMHPTSIPIEAWSRALDITTKHPGLNEWSQSFQDPKIRNPIDWNRTISWLDKLDQQRNHDWRSVLRVGALV